MARLRATIAHAENVTDDDRAEFNLAFGHPSLDPGERDLLLYAARLGSTGWLLNSPDMAAVRFAFSQGWGDRLVSLEAMGAHLKARLKETMKDNYTERWLGQRRTQLILR